MTPDLDAAGSDRGHFLAAAHADVVYVRVVGLGTMNNSLGFQGLVEQARSQGIRSWVLDLSACTGFDSTFMGILLGVVQNDGQVILINLSDRHVRTLSEVGIHTVVRMLPGRTELPDIPLQRLDAQPIQGSARARTILAAHENLLRLDPRNYDKFGAFVQMMRRELEGSTER